jgi:hypothetical protein
MSLLPSNIDMTYKETHTKDEFDKLVDGLPFSIKKYSGGYLHIDTSVANLSSYIKIVCDCRIAAMFLSCYYHKDETSFYCITNPNAIEIYIPKNCYYLSPVFDTDKSHQNLLTKLLKDMQGQWLYHHADTNDKNKYTGLVTAGLLTMSIEEWEKYYLETINKFVEEKYTSKYISTFNISSVGFGIISCLLKLNKVSFKLLDKNSFMNYNIL